MLFLMAVGLTPCLLDASVVVLLSRRAHRAHALVELPCAEHSLEVFNCDLFTGISQHLPRRDDRSWNLQIARHHTHVATHKVASSNRTIYALASSNQSIYALID